MSTIIFFPWLPLEEPLDAGPFELLPYRRGRGPAGAGTPLQQSCDAILEMYRAGPKAPIPKAAIMRLAGHAITDHLDDEVVRRVFIWGEMTAFAGLAARRYFDQMGYSNRETFRLVVQNFTDPTAGVGVQLRRRDGSAGIIVTREAAIFPRPLHGASGPRTGIDAPLLAALLARSEHEGWGRYQEAIQTYNAASADDPAVLEEFELVAVTGAFERLFDLSRGKEDDLAPRVAAALAGSITVAPADSPRVQRSGNVAKYVKRTSMREVWIRDLFQLRSQHAHGKIESQQSTLWSRREHLLLASLAFPLVVKRELEAEGHYTLTRDDRAHLMAFEPLLEPDHFLERAPLDTSPFPWSKIMSQMLTRAWVEVVVARRPWEEPERAEAEGAGGSEEG